MPTRPDQPADATAQPPRRRPGPKPVHRWDDWFARGTVRLTRGRQFAGQSHGMAQQARNAAAARGLRVSVSLDSARGIVTVTVVGRTGTGKGKR